MKYKKLRMQPIWLLGCLASALSWGCSPEKATGDSARDEAALVVYFGDTSQIVAPDTVTRGVATTVSFRTFGGGCTRTVARTEVSMLQSAVEIRPFNHTVAGPICTADILFITHSVSIVFPSAGVVPIRVVGQRRDATTPGGSPVVITRTVVVK